MVDNNIQGTKSGNTPTAASDAARQQGAEAVRQAGDVAAETAQRSSQAGAEAVQRAGDTASGTLRRGSEAFADSQRQLMQNTAQQFEEVSRKVAQAAQGTTEDLR